MSEKLSVVEYSMRNMFLDGKSIEHIRQFGYYGTRYQMERDLVDKWIDRLKTDPPTKHVDPKEVYPEEYAALQALKTQGQGISTLLNNSPDKNEELSKHNYHMVIAVLSGMLIMSVLLLWR